MTLTVERLREVLNYDPETGLLTWKKSTSNRALVGSSPTCRDTHGYPLVRIDGCLHRAHRLAFLYMTGQFPKHDLDHVDGNRANNAWANLREATRQQNHRNRKPYENTSSGVKGVSMLPSGRWRARLMIDRREIHLGVFSTIEDAKAAYAQGTQKHFGEFARTT